MEGFLQIVNGALPDCGHRAFDASLRRIENAGECGIKGFCGAHQLDAVHPRHDEIGYHQIHPLFSQQGKSFRTVVGAVDLIALTQQMILEQ